MREAEGQHRVAEIAARLVSSSMVRSELKLPNGFVLIQPSRRLLREGLLDDVRRGPELKVDFGRLHCRLLSCCTAVVLAHAHAFDDRLMIHTYVAAVASASSLLSIQRHFR